jgi:hypothetical protein
VLSQNCEKRLLASSCLSVRPSVRMEQLGSHWTDFRESLYLRIFRKCVQKIQVSLISDNNKRYFTRTPTYIFLSYLAHLFLEWEMFQTKVVEKITIHVLSSVIIFRIRVVMRKYCRAGQARLTIWRMRIVCWISKATNTHIHTHTHRFCNTHCFTTATMVLRKRLCYVIRTLPVWLVKYFNKKE